MTRFQQLVFPISKLNKFQSEIDESTSRLGFDFKMFLIVDLPKLRGQNSKLGLYLINLKIRIYDLFLNINVRKQYRKIKILLDQIVS